MKLKTTKAELLKYILKESPFCAYANRCRSETEQFVKVNNKLFSIDEFIQTALGYLELQKIYGKETMRTMDKHLPYYQKHKRL